MSEFDLEKELYEINAFIQAKSAILNQNGYGALFCCGVVMDVDIDENPTMHSTYSCQGIRLGPAMAFSADWAQQVLEDDPA